ncbi:MAG: carboxypeptidase M32 [Lachnospiraceae bacterium]|nr:carboxypeptidase M32 [Lachnospiraceae bacterium]
MTVKESYDVVDQVLTETDLLGQAVSLINYDLETICPEEAMSRQGELMAYLENQAFRKLKDPAFEEASNALYEGRDALNDYQRALAEDLHRQYLMDKNVTPELQHELSRIRNQAYVDWLAAKKASDFSIFAPSLQALKDVLLKRIALQEEAKPLPYDNLLTIYERDMTAGTLDRIFGTAGDRISSLLKKILASKKTIRRDFLTRPVTDAQQQEFAEYLLDVMHFDKKRGVLGTTEHPFTDSPWKDDQRITTNYDPNNFLSSIYSVIHEGGHALFEQLQPAENWTYHIKGIKSMGEHESVSRFYENRIGRSEAFIHLIYPRAKEIFPQVLSDVSERELYEAVNLVEPSLIRTDADEFTYTLHIIIRYELEKRILAGEAAIEDLPKLWSDLYDRYLGIRPGNDAEGVLQDVHWSGGFGYFPTYALGNFYNAMYYNTMNGDFSIDEAVRSGDFGRINGWMKEHVFAKADRLSPAEWILDITDRALTPDDFLSYLEEKYGALYELHL